MRYPFAHIVSWIIVASGAVNFTTTRVYHATEGVGAYLTPLVSYALALGLFFLAERELDERTRSGRVAQFMGFVLIITAAALIAGMPSVADTAVRPAIAVVTMVSGVLMALVRWRANRVS